jgi:hypothetical protein
LRHGKTGGAEKREYNGKASDKHDELWDGLWSSIVGKQNLRNAD